MVASQRKIIRILENVHARIVWIEGGVKVDFTLFNTG